MSNWTFEDNIPIPEVDTTWHKRRKSKYGFLAELNLNQSVFIPEDKFKKGLVSQACNRIAGKTNRKFTSRTRVENGRYGTRVWRTR